MRFPIGAWKHYNSFDEECICELCNKMHEWEVYKDKQKRGLN